MTSIEKDTQARIVALLDLYAGILDSESEFKDLWKVVDGGMSAHNPNYTYATLPSQEEELVMYRAWIIVCLIRANRYAQESNVSATTPGFTQERSTPYTKNISFSAKLEEIYDRKCNLLGINPTPAQANVITVSQALRHSNRLCGAIVPISGAAIQRTISIAASAQTSTTFILTWSGYQEFSEFYSYNIFALSDDTNTLYQSWNNSTNTWAIPLINPNAVSLWIGYTQTASAIEVSNVDFTLTNRYLLVVRSKSNTYLYSNELVLTPA